MPITRNALSSWPERLAAGRAVRTLVAAFVVLALASGLGDSPISAESIAVTAPPNSLRAGGFYAKHLDAVGIPVLSSAKAPSRALFTARSIVVEMLAHRPDLAAELVARGYRVAIMAEDEATTDLPEQAHWTRPARGDPRLTRCERKHYDARIGALSNREYWNARARGMAGVLTSGAAEDLLGLESSRYYGETIFVHEFAHNVLDAIAARDPALHAQVERAYAKARRKGRWKNEYASTSLGEYWAEGTQFWFNSNRLAVFDGRRILSDRDLARYDPPLAAVLRAAYGERHRLSADPFWMHPARVPPGPIPDNTAEVC